MAKQLTEWYDIIITEKETFSSLDGLTPKPDDSQTFLQDLSSTSKVAIWRLWVWVVAFAAWVTDNLFDEHTIQIEALGDTLITGTASWIRDQCFKFQLGDTLIYNPVNGAFEYATVNEAAQIIKRASILEVGGVVIIKVAKEDVGGNPIKLSASEKTSFNTYINQIKFAGTNTAVKSEDPDLLKIFYDVHYDPLVLSSTGESLSSPGVFPVEDAINDFISTLPFDGVLNLTELTDAVQLASGVNDPVLTQAEAKFGALPYAAINREYVADAGYMKIDPAFPLTSTLTYIADA